MNLTWTTATTCADCGADWPGIIVRQTRINKRSLRATGQGLGAFQPRCPACGGHETTGTYRYTGLHPDDLTKVNQWRQRKGWPPLNTELGLAT